MNVAYCIACLLGVSVVVIVDICGGYLVWVGLLVVGFCLHLFWLDCLVVCLLVDCF